MWNSRLSICILTAEKKHIILSNCLFVACVFSVSIFLVHLKRLLPDFLSFLKLHILVAVNGHSLNPACQMDMQTFLLVYRIRPILSGKLCRSNLLLFIRGPLEHLVHSQC